MAPCGWIVDDCGCGNEWSGYAADVRDRAEAAAGMVMWAATGRRYGLCPVTVQPAAVRRPVPLYQTFRVANGGMYSPLDGPRWDARLSGDDTDLCCTGNSCEVELEGPTTTAQITTVTLSGVVLDPAAYVVMDGRLLVRVDGGCWPSCTNWSALPAAFTVAYTIGLPIPAAVQGAFEKLACEYAKACTGGPCALPQRLTRLSRQGVEIELEQVPVDERGLTLTGIKDVDDVILAVNPHRLVQAPMVLSPDLPAPRRLT